MSNPKMTNNALVTRNDQLAITSQCVIDGTTISIETTLPRGTILVRTSVSGKWHQAVHGTDTLAANNTRILQDDRHFVPGQDLIVSAYLSGFFKLSVLTAANASYTAAELAAAGMQQIESDEVWMK